MDSVKRRLPGVRSLLLATVVPALLIAIGFGVVGAQASGVPYDEEVLADGPAGYWRLGETTGTIAADRTANANRGTYVNGVTLGVQGALQTDLDRAARFDGGNDLVTMGDPANGSLDFGTDDFTAEAWVNVTANDERVLIGKRETARFWQITLTDDPNHAGQLRANVNDGVVTRQAYSTRRVDDGAWHHVIVRFDRDAGISFFVDATPAGTTAGAMTGDISNAGALQVSKLSGYPNLRGDVDEVAVYRSLLSLQRIEAHYHATLVDDTAPVVTLVTPADGSSTTDPTPDFAGTAGTQLGDSATVTVKLYAGSEASGTPVQTIETPVAVDGSYAADASAPLEIGTYTARAEQSDRSGNVGLSSTSTITIEAGDPPPPVSTDPVLVGAGDIAGCGGADEGDEATSDLVMGLPNATVFTLGDNAYPNGTPEEFANCYAPSWGRAKARTMPAIGGHDYLTPGGAGHFDYFGAAAGDPTKGYYSYDRGDWHIVVLNSQCAEVGGCGAGSPQDRWLRTDLYEHQTSCTLAYFHEPRFSSGSVHGSHLSQQPFWQALYDYGADVVMGGDDHLYERFLPQTPDGTLDLEHGLTHFTVGTGGYYLYEFGTILPNSAARISGVYGVLRLTLHPTSYDWKFLPVAGKTGTDAGTAQCVEPAAPPPLPPPPPPPPPETSGRYPAAVLTDTPRAYWRLGESSGTRATDEMGLAHGTYQGGTILGVPGALAGEADTAIRLDGGNDQVNAADPGDGSLDFGFEDFSAEAWVKASANDERAVISKRQLGDAPYWQVTVTDDGSQTGRIRASLYDGAATLHAYGPAIRVDDGGWHHVVVAFDREEGITIYVDGESRTTPGAVPGDLSNAGNLLVGKVTGYPYFKGELDEVAVYARALSAADVDAHRAVGLSSG
jgi:hypothetical protein